MTVSHQTRSDMQDDSDTREQYVTGVIEVLRHTLQLSDEKTAGFSEATRLLGDLPELDSMAVLSVLTGMEEQFGIVLEDDDISADTFENIGTLVDLVVEKMG